MPWILKKKSLFLFKSWIFLYIYFKIPYDFTILRSEFVNGFPCRVKIAILTTLVLIYFLWGCYGVKRAP